ncbi:hypothetical protein RRF57_010668 [Xylaria bambusicola]|uniref:Protein kinase domain-containing protein n=1 Tax=Xylaria bambusicola TaxID=326684 RepID=A0AAN7ZCQ5_9PEZI
MSAFSALGLHCITSGALTTVPTTVPRLFISNPTRPDSSKENRTNTSLFHFGRPRRSAQQPSTSLPGSIMPSYSEWDFTNSWSNPRLVSGSEVLHLEAVLPGEFNFLSFLATAQALHVPFLPITWEAARQDIGFGGTSRIHQSLLNIQTSFAFKRIHDPEKQQKTEEQLFRALIIEILVLGHPAIREHPNIAHLQGICWDISPKDDKPWPVLVFEKSQYGDLYNFAKSPRGRELGISQRLKLCVDIGTAIMDIHSNILKEESGEYCAKVIDFGYATRYADDRHKIKLPARTPPWNAPEHNRDREWIPLDAARTDIFSFGMLCFWLLFEPHLSGIVTSPLDPSVVEACMRESVETLSKIKGDLLVYVGRLLTTEIDFGDTEQNALKEFFASTLSPDPQERSMNFRVLLSYLDPSRNAIVETEYTPLMANFKIEGSFGGFYRSDYRLRLYIAQKLLESYQLCPSLAFQMAICYVLGFGVPRNKEKVTEILQQFLLDGLFIAETIVQALDQIEYVPPMIDTLIQSGHLQTLDSGYTYLEHGKLEEAEKYISQEIQDLADAFTQNSLPVAVMKSNLQEIYSTRGQWEKLEEIQMDIVEIHKTLLGHDHHSTIYSMTHLSATYWELGKWEDAKELQVEVVETSKRVLGIENVHTRETMRALASTYRSLGDWQMAEKLEVELLDWAKTVQGMEHDATLATMSNLALTFWNQGRWKEAEELQVKVVEMGDTVLRTEHPKTLTRMANLASTYREQGRWTDAQGLEERIMNTRMRVLGLEHPDTLTSMTNLASTYFSQGDWQAAERLEGEVMALSRRVRGMEHPETLTTISNLASTYRARGKWKEAEKLETEVVETSTRVLGAEHPDTLISIGNLATTYIRQGDYQRAEALQLQAMEIGRRVLGIEHPDTLTSSSNLAMTYKMQGRWSQAEKLLLEVLETSRGIPGMGMENLDTQSTMNNLALMYVGQERWKEAEELELQVTETRKRLLGTEHPYTRASIANLAALYKRQARWEEAEELLTPLVETSERLLGVDHPETWDGIIKLVGTLMSLGRHSEAIVLMKDAFQRTIEILGPVDALVSLMRAVEDQGIVEALALLERVGEQGRERLLEGLREKLREREEGVLTLKK